MEHTPPDRARLLASYTAGVDAVRTLAGRVPDWQAPTPCPDWQVGDLVGHLRCVAENYLEYLQDAPDSRLATLFARDTAAAVLIRQQARQNAAELAVLPVEAPPARVMAFTVSAGAYADLASDQWDRAHLIYRGTKYTVGDHMGAACVEWHLHAWDLARAVGSDHRPGDPELLAAAWRWGVPHLPLSGPGWEGLLRSSGRSPDWTAPGSDGARDGRGGHGDGVGGPAAGARALTAWRASSPVRVPAVRRM